MNIRLFFRRQHTESCLKAAGRTQFGTLHGDFENMSGVERQRSGGFVLEIAVWCSGGVVGYHVSLTH